MPLFPCVTPSLSSLSNAALSLCDPLPCNPPPRLEYPPRFKDYAQVFSTDEGRSFSAPRMMRGIGVVRPQLLLLGDPAAATAGPGAGSGPLLLAGGRRRNHNSSDICLWVSDDGLGRAWREISITAVHNSLVCKTAAPRRPPPFCVLVCFACACRASLYFGPWSRA